MKGSADREDIEIKRNYVFYEESENLAKHAEKSGGSHRSDQNAQLRHNELCGSQRSGNLVNSTQPTDEKTVKNFLANQTVQAHPFTFIKALKRKLALAAYNETNPHPRVDDNPENPDISLNLNINESSSLYEEICKMNFVKPLKVPDVKISPKPLDYTAKETPNARDSSSLKHIASQKIEKSVKSTERAHRKLDFSLSEGHSFLSSEEIEPLRVPDLSISPSLNKQKENAREKENRSKRMKKEDSSLTRNDDEKRIKNSRHMSRKDEVKRSRNDRTSSHFSKDSETIGKKLKTKNVVATLRKEEEKRMRSTRPNLRDKSLESRGRTISSESLSDRNSKNHEKILSRTCTDSDVSKYNDDYQILNALRQIDESKQKSTDSKGTKILPRSSSSLQKSNDSSAKEHKKSTERSKMAAKNLPLRGMSSGMEISEEKDTHSDSSGNKNRSNDDKQSKNKTSDSCDAEKIAKPINETSSDDIAIDPSRISFRDDSYSQQEEFCDLVTPDVNLMFRSKRRKQSQTLDSESEDVKNPKNRSRITEISQNSNEKILNNPTSLHMQFQAELQLFDSYNESLRQINDVEKCLYGVKNDREPEMEKFLHDETKRSINQTMETGSNDVTNDDDGRRELKKVGNHEDENETRKKRPEAEASMKPEVKVAEVQTQTANDIATQTDQRLARNIIVERPKQYPGITYERGDKKKSDIFTLDDIEKFQDIECTNEIDKIDDLSSKLRAMSEISLHETTSSIKTETGTEISISTRDLTCSFNKYLDHEMAQLIKDEKLMYDKIEMLFKSREKTLNDRTRKLAKLEEQKRALRDTGQDSRISSVKKKQRALLLKLQQEKDEMNRLKELHKMASQERKLMLQKQRNMFNPQMSTKNILTKLKRSADCQSPRRLSGPMKGYDIRSNSSMSSLLDSDKSQFDRSHLDGKIFTSDNSLRLEGKSLRSDIDNSAPDKLETNNKSVILDNSGNSTNNVDRFNDFIGNYTDKLESRARKYEEKMPNTRNNYLTRQNQSPSIKNHDKIIENEITKIFTTNADNADIKSESDTLVEELSKKSKSQNIEIPRETLNREDSSNDLETMNFRKSKSSQVTEESLLNYRISKKNDKSQMAEVGKKSSDLKTSKRKAGKSLKGKSTSSVLTENIQRSKIVDISEDEKITKRNKIDAESNDEHYKSSILEELDLNESQNSLHALVKHSRAVKDKNYKILRDIAASDRETKENIMSDDITELKNSEKRDNEDPDIHNLGNISTRSQVSTFTISRHSSGDSEKSFSRSVVIRAQENRFKTSKKLEQALNAREAAVTTRRNCVEDWIAWHTKLKAEESRVARMEQAAFKLVSTTANAFSYNDTTMSSDTSDVEERVEQLAEKLAERRVEMSKLKREARRQAKQRLKALEANLLNQIKKYDTTIHEMRKKLETQKGAIKDSDKLAIESRSVTDFKVPEIPLKRIQEIYNSSDLLRSRSESDLIFSKNSHHDNHRNSIKTDSENNDNNGVYESSIYRDSEKSRISKSSSNREPRTNQSAESVLEEAKNFTQSIADKETERSESKLSNASRSSENIVIEDARNFKNTGNSEDSRNFKNTGNSEDSQNSKNTGNSEDSRNFKNTGNSEDSRNFKNTGNSEDSQNFKNTGNSEDSQISKNTGNSGDSQISKNTGNSEDSRNFKHTGNSEDSQNSKNTGYSETIEEPKTIPFESEISEIPEISEIAKTDGSSKVFSRKLESLQLTNKNLNDDISTLENDLRALSEMMSHFSKKSDEKLTSGVESVTENIGESIEKDTSRDISENSTKSRQEKSEKRVSSVEEQLENEISERNDLTSEIAENIEKSLSSELVAEVMSAIITENSTIVSEKIDFEARSKEILNVIEKSIISERAKSPLNESNKNEEEIEKSMNLVDTEKDSQVSPEVEGKSISSAISKITDSPKISSHLENRHETLEDKFEMPIFLLNNDEMISEIVESHEEILESEEIDPIVLAKEITENSVKLNDTTIVSDWKNYEKSGKSSESDEEVTESILEELSDSQKSGNSSENSENVAEVFSEHSTNDNNEEFRDTDGISIGKISIDHDWTISDSFQISEKPEIDAPGTKIMEIDREEFFNEKSAIDAPIVEKENFICDMDEVSMFIPRGESTTIGYKFDDTILNITKNDSMQTDELDDILDIIARESEINEKSQRNLVPEIVVTNVEDTENLAEINFTEELTSNHEISRNEEIVIPRPTDLNLTAEVEPVLQKLTEILQGVERKIARKRRKSDDIEENRIFQQEKLQEKISPKISPISSSESVLKSKISSLEIEKLESEPSELVSFISDVIFTNIDDSALENSGKSSIFNKRYSPDEKSPISTEKNSRSDEISPIFHEKNDENDKSPIFAEENSRHEEKSPIFSDKNSEDENSLIVDDKSSRHDEKTPIFSEKNFHDDKSPIFNEENSQDDKSPIFSEKNSPYDDKSPIFNEEQKSPINDDDENRFSGISEKQPLSKMPENTFEILRDPEYEDISEESLEVSEILDRSESQKSGSLSKNVKIPEKYEMKQKTDDVLRILDEISQKSYGRVNLEGNRHLHDVQISVQVFGSISPGFASKRTSPRNDDDFSAEKEIGAIEDIVKSVEIDEIVANREDRSIGNDEEREKESATNKNRQDEILAKEQEIDRSSESSDGADTPRGVSEIEMDSPRDPNESRLDIDGLDDDLLSSGENAKLRNDGKTDFPATTTIASSEKDIEAMIEKLKASLEQPGLEVAELEAKLLRIEQLQIELEIKKLEAEEVSFYVREIPNKPPPPYTPPGGGRLATPQLSPTLPPAVVPTNVEELTAFTEKATVLIFNAKNSGDDIMSLEPPLEICQLTKDSNETAKQDRKIYNTFLFDLCKETIAELYRSEYERPGPSWTKPNVKTKPAMKIPKTLDELNEYVGKEVATLFGFKTKLQRENMVMRWSRKRRDRVDELLAREAQAEEDEWTKFHNDELAVKNELTVAILDTLILETANVVKAVYAKKRKIAV